MYIYRTENSMSNDPMYIHIYTHIYRTEHSMSNNPMHENIHKTDPLHLMKSMRAYIHALAYTIQVTLTATCCPKYRVATMPSRMPTMARKLADAKFLNTNMLNSSLDTCPSLF